jgi:cell division control protein 6
MGVVHDMDDVRLIKLHTSRRYMSDGSDLDDIWATGEIFDDEEVLHEHWTPESVPERAS